MNTDESYHTLIATAGSYRGKSDKIIILVALATDLLILLTVYMTQYYTTITNKCVY